MENNDLLQLNEKHRGRQIWLRFMSVLMGITVFITTYALIVPAVTMDTSDPSVTHINWGGIEWDDAENVFRNISLVMQTQQDTTYTLQSSDDNGVTWSNVTGITYVNQKPGAQAAYTLVANSTPLDTMFQDAPLTRKYRFNCKGKKSETNTSSYDFVDLLDVVKPHFKEWLAGDYAERMGGTAPTTKAEYLSVFDTYYHIPTAVVTVAPQASESAPVTASAAVMDMEGSVLPAADYHYQWQYYDMGDDEHAHEWKTIAGENGTSYSVDPASPSPIPFGGAMVRCIVTNAADDTFVTKSDPVLLNPQQYRFSGIIPTIESSLGLSAYPINNAKTLDLRYTSTDWDWVYFKELAEDPEVPFEDKESYWNELCKTYCKTYDEAIGEGKSASEAGAAAADALRKEWNYYRYDMIDPGAKNTNYGTYYETGGFADSDLAWVKTNDNDDSFHYKPVSNPTEEKDKLILPLNYNYLDEGVDYDSFIKDMSKYATADAAGDANAERKYNINMTTDAHAQLKAPIVIIFQIQTSWQLFDLEHANALAGQGGTEIGAVANNTALASFYDIKHAMLDLLKYVEAKYPGNNLVIGVTEVRHGGSDSMFESSFTTSTGSTAPLYVSNNPEVLFDAVSQWDIFGNCEHVHYDNDTLELALQNLGVDLSDFKDKNNNKITYDDIRKTAVIIGGPTENRGNENGYNCVLPWDEFEAAGIDSVYGIRVNEGTSYAGTTAKGTPILSWLDIDENNDGHYKDGNGANGFTEKYVCTTREMLYEKFIQIIEQEFAIGGIDIFDVNKNVDNLAMTDTIRNEFQLDPDKPFRITMTPDLNGERYLDATVDLKALTFSGTYSGTVEKTTSGNTTTYTMIYGTSPGDAPHPTEILVTDNTDGTTTVEVRYNKIFNTQKAEVNFGIQAKSGYIGSNNVYTNVGYPQTTFSHYNAIEDKTRTYSFRGKDQPQVNVPIEFTTENGGHKVLYRSGTSVDYDISLNNASVIPASVQGLIDDFGQINGTLSYEWILPDGTTGTLGETKVVDGKPQSGFPNLSEVYSFDMDGFFDAQLIVTFTPEDTDPEGEFHDVKTATAVKEKDHPGVVTFQVVSASTVDHLTVKKTWIGSGPFPASITFKLIYEDGDGVQHFYQEGGTDKVFTLTGTSDPPWTGTFEVKPTPDGEGSVYEYSAVEATVPGYTSTITFSIDKTYEYEAALSAYFTPQYANVSSSDRIIVYYRYKGTDYTKEYTGETLYKDSTWIKELANNLSTEEDGTPYAAAVTKIEYVSGGNVYTVFKNDIDPYDCEVTQVGYPVFTFTASAKIDKNTTITVNYKVGGVSKSFSYKLPANIPNGSTFTLTATELEPAGSVITDVTDDSAKCALVSSPAPYLGMKKQYVTFTTPIALAKDKFVEVTLKKVGGTETYVGEYKIPDGGFSAGAKIGYEFPDVLPDGEYYLYDLNYVHDGTTTPMTEKTKVTVVMKNALPKEEADSVTVTLSNGATATYAVPNGGIAAGSSIVFEFDSNPPAGTTISSITCKKGGNTFPLITKTILSVRTPIALAANKVFVATITDNTTTATPNSITVSYKLPANVAADGTFDITKCKLVGNNAEKTLDEWLRTTFGTDYSSHSYSVTNIGYKNAENETTVIPLVTPGSVSFVIPYGTKPNGDPEEINIKEKDVVLTVKDGSTTVKTMTVKVEKKDHKSGTQMTVLFPEIIPDNESYTYELTADGRTVTDFSISCGGTPADAILNVGGETPQSSLYIGGQLPDNKVTSDGFSTITATMKITENVTVDSSAVHTVTWIDRETGETGTFTAVPVISGTTATFTNSDPIPAGDYEILSITRPVGGTAMPYYNDLNAYHKTESMLKSIRVDSSGGITNTPIVFLPATGSSGYLPYIMTGLGLMIGSIIYGFILRRRHERRADG